MFNKRKMNTEDKVEEREEQKNGAEATENHETPQSGTDVKNGSVENDAQAKTANDKEAELKDLNDKYIRLYAEFDNFRRRGSKERIETILQANKDLILKLIPVVDDFDRAMSALE